MKFYHVRKNDLWGSYGPILVHGMTGHQKRNDGLLQLARAGPFVPPVTFPGLHEVVVTDNLRRELESTSRIIPIEFRRVTKSHIVELHWHTWNLDADEPEEYPVGAPEDYIFARPHSEEMAKQIGDIWEVILRQGGNVTLIKKGRYDSEIRIIESTWNGDHFFLAKNPNIEGDFGLYPVVTDIGKASLEEGVGKSSHFVELAID